MDDLIEALKIFKKHGPEKWGYPFHCEHDTLFICGIVPADVPDEDKKRLDELGFIVDPDEDCFISYRFGSA